MVNVDEGVAAGDSSFTWAQGVRPCRHNKALSDAVVDARYRADFRVSPVWSAAELKPDTDISENDCLDAAAPVNVLPNDIPMPVHPDLAPLRKAALPDPRLPPPPAPPPVDRKPKCSCGPIHAETCMFGYASRIHRIARERVAKEKDAHRQAQIKESRKAVMTALSKAVEGFSPHDFALPDDTYIKLPWRVGGK